MANKIVARVWVVRERPHPSGLIYYVKRKDGTGVTTFKGFAHEFTEQKDADAAVALEKSRLNGPLFYFHVFRRGKRKRG